jgi:mannosyltransferase
MRAFDHDARDWGTIALPSVLAAVLCFHGITSRSLGFDEGATVAIASQHGSALGSAIAHDGGNMSGYYLLLHVLISAFGNGLLVLRFPSALATIATVALIGVIGLRCFDRRVALIAGLLAAVSLPLVYWAQTARGYALMVAFVCAGYIAFCSLADAAPAGPPKRRAWIAYVVLMTLATYSSFVAVLVVPAQLLVLVRRPRAAARLASALVALAVCCVPLAILAVRRGSGQLFWVPKPTRKVETQVLQSLTSAGLQPSFHRTATTVILLIVTLLALVGIAIVLVRARGQGEAGWPAAMTLAWFAVPVALTFVYSLVAQPIFLPRNLLMCVPAGGLLLALGITDRRLPRLVAPIAVVVLVALRALQVGASYGVSPEPWRAASADVLARARPGDCIAFYPEDGRMAFQYYVGTGTAAARKAPRSILPVARWGVVTPYVEDYLGLSPSVLARRSAGCRRLWFVSSHEGELNGPQQSRANRALFRRLGGELQRAFGHAKVKQYGYASAVHVQLLPGIHPGPPHAARAVKDAAGRASPRRSAGSAR